MDFYKIKTRTKGGKKGEPEAIELYPDFKVCRSNDLMVRGKSFYAVWDPGRGLWSTDEYDVQRIVDEELYNEAEKVKCKGSVVVKSMSDFSSRSWYEFRKYMANVSDSYHQLDERVAFADDQIDKHDYISKRLPYSLKEGTIEAYEDIVGTLYEPEERAKLEWAIGSIFAGDARDIQKFIVLYGAAGAGKSTMLNIIQMLFQGYYTTFDAKALGSSSNAFATEVFKSNPLVAIQHDGDLSKIEDNTKLNSIVSHEEMTMNEKYKPSYSARVNCFLFMGTNKPVKITDAKSGIIRRLIDVRPSGRRIAPKLYSVLMSQVGFELGAIAFHCLKVYREMGKNYYNTYRPVDMMFQTDVFFNFVEDSFDVFKENDGVTLKSAYSMYKEYCDDSATSFKLPKYKFREELKNYFDIFEDRCRKDGVQLRNYYSGFQTDKFKGNSYSEKEEKPLSLTLDCEDSILDSYISDQPAQYANDSGVPSKKWESVKTKLSDIDTKKLHYVQLPENHIVIDFDLKDESGEKSLEKNMEAASSWPATYSELSKSGKGLHLHYVYPGDPTELARLYSDDIEIKVFTGNSSLRRKVIRCNDIPVATIESGLPFKEKKKVINANCVKSERGLRRQLERNLNKEIHPGTKPSVDFIHKILEDAYNSEMAYDVSDMRPRILAFANNSTNQSEYCVKLVSKMKFKSEVEAKSDDYEEDQIIFFDVEVFPNLFLINWKFPGEDKECVRMINPTPAEVEDLFKFKLIGFNNRRYDNHILYARHLGFTNEQLYNLSMKLIGNSKNATFANAYNLSYTDVYDFASTPNKKSLKKWEIELGNHHQELGLPWDQSVAEEDWVRVAEYCDNDVIATEAVFNHLSGDWLARQILADLAEMTVNDTTNKLTTKIIFGDDKAPQSEFLYRNLAEPVHSLDSDVKRFLKKTCPDMMSKKHGEKESLLPYFEGYTFDGGKSVYKGEEVGEGGFVYSEPGMYSNVALLDITSMHPHSVISECLFGPKYTQRFYDLVYGRVDIKHEEWDEINHILEGKLTKYVQDVKDGKLSSKSLADALKTAINSVYGLTAAKFDNAFRDNRNKDNIVAKRGALFMVDLKEAVQKQGFTVAHIKTDSIKIPNASPEIIEFVKAFGKDYGYTFEHEATYSKMCLVNDAVYIANIDGSWTATGAQFAHPYIFKTLFSHQPLDFRDLCETKSVTSALYLDMNESMGEDEHNYIFVGKVGSFCPIKEGCGGGLLVRESNGKYNAATGSKGYRWLESETVEKLDKMGDIDYRYFDKLADEAKKDISKFGDFDWFVSDKTAEDVPPWEDVN